ncbi:MAG: UbiA-like polyprenyltransferase, partial [Candidatus Omnitrophota bacterium]
VGTALEAFFLAKVNLNPLCLKLSPVAFVALAGYHTLKRFHFLCHFALGLVLAIAPMGGWIAVTGTFSWLPVPLALAVLFWVAGFDIIYSLQDYDFDRAWGLHSAPVRFGQAKAIRISEVCHAATVVFLVVFGIATGLGILYWLGVLATAVLLKLEHTLISENDLSRIHAAFFTINGWIGILLLIFTLLETFR